jgi:uncharacterized membrane protein
MDAQVAPEAFDGIIHQIAIAAIQGAIMLARPKRGNLVARHAD